jgi:hypothetical protein
MAENIYQTISHMTATRGPSKLRRYMGTKHFTNRMALQVNLNLIKKA